MLDSIQQIDEFAQRIFVRSDGRDTVIPAGHKPDWKDRPSASRLYPADVPRVKLPSLAHVHRAYRSLIHAPGLSKSPTPSTEQLSLLLYLTTGLLRRKLDINWNNLPASPIGFVHREYGHGSASGGGLYPVQIYVAAGSKQSLKPGLYHYSTAQHSLAMLRFGDWTQDIAEAAETPNTEPQRYPYYLVLSVDFWMNCFKYHNFGYHVVSEDTGVMLATTELIADSLGIAHRCLLTFHDARVNRILGVDGSFESAFAVVGLGDPLPSARRPELPDGHSEPAAVRPYRQRSRKINIPHEFQRIHQLTLLEAPLTGLARGSEAIEVPGSALEQAVREDLPSVLLARRSAWNSMQSRHNLQARQLHELLRFISRRLSRTTIRELLPEDSLSLALRVNRVTGLEPGAYVWDTSKESLEPKPSANLAVWQSTYAMQNYNIDQTACILFVAGRLDKALASYGARGYRILNAYVGMTAQLAYVAAAALGLDSGVVLGVRAQHVKRTLLLDADQNVFLAIYLSGPQAKAELFRFHIAPDIPIWNPVN